MKSGTPDLLSSAALPPTVKLPDSLALEPLPVGVTYDVDEDGQPCVVVDLTKVPRHLRRKALQRFQRVGDIPKRPRHPKRPNKRRAAANAQEELMALEITGHEWSLGRGGRTIVKQRTGNNLRVVATLHCSRDGCGGHDAIKHRAVLPADLLDKRFVQKGWKLDPPVCPSCVQQPKEERMASETATVSANAGMAQAKVFKLLTAQFDETKGRYSNGYSDERIAKETGCALVFVQNCRRECFGELKEDPAVAELRSEVGALESMIMENTTQLQQELAQLKAKLARLAQ